MASESKKSSPVDDENAEQTISTAQVGIWAYSTVKRPRFDPLGVYKEMVSAFQLFQRLVIEISTVSRTMLLFFILSKLWAGVESAIMMHLSSDLLRIIEISLRNGESNQFPIIMAIINRLSCVAFVAALNHWTSDYTPMFKTRIMQHYEMYLMQARLDLDLSSALDPDAQVHIQAYDAWNAFETIISYFGELLTLFSQLTLIIHVTRYSGGPFFALLCVAKPLLKTLFAEDLWSKMWVVNLKHEHYQRMDALSTLTHDEYRQDYITGNLGGHIMSEYKKAKEKLGDTCTDEFWEQFNRKQSLLAEVFFAIASDLPMVYCAVNAMINPSKFSIASIAVLQQSSTSLRWSLWTLVRDTQSFRRHATKLKNMYALATKNKRAPEGNIPYPTSSSSEDGMALELRNVIFEYPGSKNKSPALNDVSLSLKEGQLVVIVGANGSGKSTIVKLLTRLYMPTSGTLFIDGKSAKDYRSSDIRQTTACFTQDHKMFPLSLYENVALGDVTRATDSEAVNVALEQGGAKDFVSKLEEGLDTFLDPRSSVYTINVPDETDHPLRQRMKKLSKKIDISGGEKQRLVASRTFMQLNSGRIRFVAVDEPSSALDPEAEYQMFNRLIANRKGKTMVFVTHRFGHLTKHADVIICMKDGAVAESGSHETLMNLNGEYAKLYQIQADAFSRGQSDRTSEVSEDKS